MNCRKAIIDPRSMEELDSSINEKVSVIHFYKRDYSQKKHKSLICTIVLRKHDYNSSFGINLIRTLRNEFEIRTINNFKRYIEHLYGFPFGYAFRTSYDKNNIPFAIRVAKERLIHSLIKMEEYD